MNIDVKKLNNPIIKKKINSSNIASMEYYTKDGLLVLEFNKGDIYHFYNVEEEKAKALATAESVGKYFHQNIKGKYFMEQYTV